MYVTGVVMKKSVSSNRRADQDRQKVTWNVVRPLPININDTKLLISYL